MEAFFGFLKVAAICGAALFALFLVLMALPRSPLRDLVTSLTMRVGATVVGGTMMVPDLTIPVIGEVADVGILVFLAVYWYSFFRALHRNASAAGREAASRIGPGQTAPLPNHPEDRRRLR